MTTGHGPAEADLLAVARHREQVLARRLVRQHAMPFAEALLHVLQTAAGSTPLVELIASRHHAKAVSDERQAARRIAVRLKFTAKKAALAPDPSAWHAWFDGSALPNPGRIGIGAVLRAPVGMTVHVSRRAGIGDSNRAEYLALIAVLEAAVLAGACRVIVHGDSQVVIGDVLGHVPVRTGSLHAPRLRARQLLAQFAFASLVWIPRERNEGADALARQALGMVAAECDGQLDSALDCAADRVPPETSSSSMFDAVQK